MPIEVGAVAEHFDLVPDAQCLGKRAQHFALGTARNRGVQQLIQRRVFCASCRHARAADVKADPRSRSRATKTTRASSRSPSRSVGAAPDQEGARSRCSGHDRHRRDANARGIDHDRRCGRERFHDRARHVVSSVSGGELDVGPRERLRSRCRRERGELVVDDFHGDAEQPMRVEDPLPHAALHDAAKAGRRRLSQVGRLCGMVTLHVISARRYRRCKRRPWLDRDTPTLSV